MPDLQSTTDLLRLLGDQTRLRLLAVLREEELTVAELTAILQLAQSRVSTHLGLLREAGLVRSRRAGASTFYTLAESLPDEAEPLWLVVSQAEDALLDQDRERAREVIAARHGDLPWADSVAGRMARHYSPGRTWESAARGIVGLLSLGRVLDVASGDGAIAELLAPHAREVVCLDHSERIVAVGAERLRHHANLRFVEGDMHALPFEAATFDTVLLMSALDYAIDPSRVLAEAARVLVPGGRLVGVTLREHAHDGAVAPYNHVQMGFDPDQLRAELRRAGFTVDLCAPTSRERRPPHFEVCTFHARR